jgi:hypothetical protein
MTKVAFPQKCVLDIEGVALVPSDYTLVQNEVELWRSFACAEAIWVRGSEELRSWAYTALSGRGCSVETKANEYELLLDRHPGLKPWLNEIIQRAGVAGTGASLVSLARAVLPGLPIDGVGTADHLLKLLLWKVSSTLDQAQLSLAESLVEHWANSLSGDLAWSYLQLADGDPENHFLNWFSLGEERRSSKWVKPPEVDEAAIARFSPAVEQWIKNKLLNGRAVELRSFFVSDAPRAVKKLVLDAFCSSIKVNPSAFVVELEFLNEVAPYATSAQYDSLLGLISPPQPGPFPNSLHGLSTWYSGEYLPFRKWEHKVGDPTARQILEELWPKFTVWYLDQLRSALNGSDGESELAFRKVRTLWKVAEKRVVLLVILDGLLPGDEKDFLDAIRAKLPIWDVIESCHVATLVPTITEYCKVSLIHGMPPKYVTDSKNREVRNRNDAIVATLQATDKGSGFVIWAHNEPDWTYHSKSGTPDNTRFEVSKSIQGIATDLISLLSQIPADADVTIAVTSDHGRSLGASPRTLPSPTGGIAHDRAVHLNEAPDFADAYKVTPEGVVFLDESTFGIGNGTSAIPLGGDTFAKSPMGESWFVHGGALPEETLVPWLVLSRKTSAVLITGSATMTGSVGKECALTLSLSNLSEVALSLIMIQLQHSAEPTAPVRITETSIGALSNKEITLSLIGHTNYSNATQVNLLARKPSGEILSFEIPCEVTLRAMQDRNIDLLEDFEI